MKTKELVIRTITLACILAAAPIVAAVGTPAGTDISNQANVTYDVGANSNTTDSNAVVVKVAEIVDVDVTLQSAQVSVAPDDVNQGVLYTLTNTGNGTETFTLSIESVIAGDDFDPTPSTPYSIFFDTDGSGDLSAGDTPYVAGTNDPTLAADASVSILIVNDIPSALSDGDIGQTRLTAESTTGTGTPGTVVAAGGDGGVDALIGSSSGSDAELGEYIVESMLLDVTKSVQIVDPFGGTSPIPGAELTYQISTVVTGSGSATNVVVNDVVPANTSYVPGSLMLNGLALSDAADADAGTYDALNGPKIVVDIGNLSNADGAQIVEFEVVIE